MNAGSAGNARVDGVGAVLALDQGSHASRACLYDAEGTLVAQKSLAVATRNPREGWVEQDADQLADTLQGAADAVLSGWRGTVVSAGLATQRSTIVCVRRSTLAPLSPAISWQDRRHHRWLATLQPEAAAIRALTGLPLSPHYGASKMRWCLDELPAVRAAAQAGDLLLLPLAAFLCSRLTGIAPRVDPANASRTLLFDCHQFGWSPAQLARFGIKAEWLPECVPTDAGFGELRAGGHRLPLAVCTGDQSAVPFAAGAIDADGAYVNLGTGAFLQRPLRDAPPTLPATATPLIAGVLARVGGHRWLSLEGTVNGAGAALQWYCESRGAQQEALWQALPDLPADARLPIFLNGIGGLGSPWWQPVFDTRFLADESPPPEASSTAVLAGFAAVLESIVFILARNLELMVERSGPIARLYVGGGIARSSWLCQQLADCTNLRVARLDEEATARGVARLAAPALSASWQDADGSEFRPASATSTALATRRQRFDSVLASELSARSG